MTNKTYEVIETWTGNTFIKAIDGNGNQFAIPINEENSDYQEYLASLEETEKETE